jgi:hypothetical protein
MFPAIRFWNQKRGLHELEVLTTGVRDWERVVADLHGGAVHPLGVERMTPQKYFEDIRREAEELLDACDSDRDLEQAMTGQRARMFLTALIALTEREKVAA